MLSTDDADEEHEDLTGMDRIRKGSLAMNYTARHSRNQKIHLNHEPHEKHEKIKDTKMLSTDDADERR